MFRSAAGDEPLIPAEDRAALPALIEGTKAALEPVDRKSIPAIVGYLSVAFPARERVEAEEKARLRHYIDGLDDLPADILQEAARLAVRKCKFMPTVAELRELALPLLGKRRARLFYLQRLKDRADSYRPPEERADPAEVAKIMASLSLGEEAA